MDTTTTPEETAEAPKRAKRAKSEVEPAAEPTEASVESLEASASTEAPESATPAAEPAVDPAVAEAVADAVSEPISERRRIQEQLEALERKQAELRRALAIADHPELADAIRVVEGRAYAVTRAEAKMAQGLSKAEERRRETLEKKLSVARAKRDEIEAQIAELERELAPLGEERLRAFEQERREALEALVVVLGQHDAAFAAAGLDVGAMVPEVARWTDELKTLAEAIVARGKNG